MRRRNSTGTSCRAETDSPTAGGNTCNGVEEPPAHPCFPNWMQIVWSWWGCVHPSWLSDSIATSELRSSRSNDGMIALKAKIQNAKAVIRESAMRPLLLIKPGKLVIPAR